MWEGLVRAPRGRVSARNLIVLLATCLVAFLAHLLFISTPVHAADAYWKDGAIVYADHTYAKQTATSSDNLGLAAGTEYYLYTEPIPGTQARKAFIIYFASGTSPPQASEAKHKTYTFSNGTFTNGSIEKVISIQPSPTTSDSGRMSETSSTCDLSGGLGWIICPVSRAIANAMDYVYGVIADFLKVQPLQVTQNGPLYKAWDIARNLANVCFIIGFLVVIYSQITGGLITNYSIRKIMPRIVVVAVLINISYWICAAMVDISNIMGYSIRDLFNSIGDSLGAANSQPSWTDVTEFLLTGGTAIGATIGGSVALLAATGGSFASLIYLLLMAMVSVIFAALVALIILAMRQALITVLIITAPLAFVLYLLPNTEKWFGKWREGFTAMMFMFPIFSVIFGASQLAGKVIIQNASSPAVAILGLVVQVAPLVVTPMIVKFSGSLLGRIAGMVNNSRKGMFDRTKNMLKDRADYHAARARSNAADKVKQRGKAGFLRPTQLAYRHERAKMKREDWKKGYEERTAQIIHADEKYQRGRRESYNPTSEDFNKRQELDVYKRDTDAYHKMTEAKHEKHWNDLLDPNNEHGQFDAERFEVRAKTHKYEKGTKAAQASTEATLREFDAGKNTITVEQMKGTKGTTASKEELARALSSIATETHDYDQRIVFEGERQKSAEIEIQGQIASAFKENELTINGVNIREYVGGIQGEAGATRVYAKARSEIVGAYVETVKNARSLLSEYSAKELIRLSQDGVARDGSTYADQSDAMRIAAQQEILLTKGNNWAFQKEKDYVAQMGMVYDEDSTVYDTNGEQVRYFNVRRDSEGNALRNADGSYQTEAILDASGAIDQSQIDNRRDTQQMFVDAVKNSKLKIASISGTDRSDMETGTFVQSGKQAIIRDALDGKTKPDRWAGMDYDEMMRTAQLMRENGPESIRSRLGPEKLQSLKANINTALTDPRLNVHLEDRQIAVLKAIQNYADFGDRTIGVDDMRAAEGPASKVPRTYDYLTPYNYSDPVGPG